MPGASFRRPRAFKERQLRAGELVVTAMFGDDQGDVVMLLMRGESLDFVNDGGEG